MRRVLTEGGAQAWPGAAAALALALAVGGAGAETIYKSVDAAGRVTYSTTPPGGAAQVQPVSVPPEPSDRDVQDALERRQELEQAGAQLEQERAAERARRQERLKGAEDALRKAQSQLDQARVQREEDWQGRAGGGHYLKDSYFQRQQAAEAAVRAAEEALDKTRRDLR